MVVKLGQEVRHTVTGFTGIAVSLTQFMQGCRRVEVQPRVDKEGKLPELACFDEPELEVIGCGVFVEKAKKTGGPHSGSNPKRPNMVSRR